MKQDPLHELRRTGRTWRMLEYVAGRVAAGKYIFVICASRDHAKHLQQRALQLIGGTLAGQNKLYPSKGGEISFEIGNGMFDWHSLRVRGSHPNCEVVVDHWAIELEWDSMLRELHRWDLPDGEDGAILDDLGDGEG